MANVHQDLLGPLIDAGSKRRVRELGNQIAWAAQSAERDAKLLRDAVDIRSAEADDPTGSASDAAYAAAFRAAQIDVDKLGPEAAGEKIEARPAGIALALAAALDDWAAERLQARSNDADAATRLVATARIADPDEIRDRLRRLWSEAILESLREPLLQLAKEADPRSWPPATLIMLAHGLARAGDQATAVDLLGRAQAEHPADVWINYNLAWYLEQFHPPRTDEAIRFYSVARTLRPETAHELAHLLGSRGRGDDAVVVFSDLTRPRPQEGRHWGCLARLLQQRGDRAGAEAALEKAVAASRETIRLRPDDANAQVILGAALCDAKHDYRGAAAEFREAIRLDPQEAVAYYNLGIALSQQGKLEEATAASCEAVRHKPDFAEARCALARALQNQRKLSEAIAECREAIPLKPDNAEAHNGLGFGLLDQRRLDQAISEYREAIRLKPDEFEAHFNLGFTLRGQGTLDDTADEFRQAAGLRPDDYWAHGNLGVTLRDQGKLAEAIAESRRARDLAKGNPQLVEHFQRGLADSERRLCVRERLPAVLGGNDKAKDAAEGIEFAVGLQRGALRRLGPSVLRVSPGRFQAGLAPKLPENERAACRAFWADVDALLNKVHGDRR
jgi:tetratricopeptide (TPR) repeat protein